MEPGKICRALVSRRELHGLSESFRDGIKNINSCIQGGVDGCQTFGFVGRSVKIGHSHAAKADPSNRRPVFTKRTQREIGLFRAHGKNRLSAIVVNSLQLLFPLTSMPLNILSIQSSVAYGHVGNCAAVFPLQRIGVEVWPVNTVHFSNHTGYGTWRGLVLPVESVAEVIRGIEERKVLPRCAGVLSGYMGDVSLGTVVLDAVAKVRAANPDAVYCCDPVMGDVGRGFFVRPGIPEFMKDHAVPAATMVTPNQFELEHLASTEISDLESALRAVDVVRACGPKVVLVTSLRRQDARGDCIEVLAVNGSEAYIAETPFLPLNVNGAGDMAAALFFVHWLRTGAIREALELTVAAVFGVLEATARAGAREMQLVEAQEAIANPEQRFLARRVR